MKQTRRGGQRIEPGRLPQSRSARRAHEVARDAVVVEGIGVGTGGLEVMLALIVRHDVGPEVLVVDLVEYRSDGRDAERHEQHAGSRTHQLRRQAQEPPHQVKG